jgi:hypothetical protein
MSSCSSAISSKVYEGQRDWSPPAGLALGPQVQGFQTWHLVSCPTAESETQDRGRLTFFSCHLSSLYTLSISRSRFLKANSVATLWDSSSLLVCRTGGGQARGVV